LFQGGDFFEIDADSGKLTWKKAFTPGLDCIKDGIIFLPVTVNKWMFKLALCFGKSNFQILKRSQITANKILY
jgi:hypothetical protein